MKVIRIVIAAGAAIALASCSSEKPEQVLTIAGLVADVDTFCKTIESDFAYFAEKGAHWDIACEQARVMARGADLGSRSEVLAPIEHLVIALHDPHTHLGTSTAGSPPLMPTLTDLVVDASGEVLAVRKGYPAQAAGLRQGDRITAINGLAWDAAVATRIAPRGVAPSHAKRLWAANSVVNGSQRMPRELTFVRDGRAITVAVGDQQDAISDAEDAVSHRMLDDGIGYIRLNNSLGRDDTVDGFDAALDSLISQGVEAMMLDLRDTPSGGNTGVAEPILGRLVREDTPYQLMQPHNGRGGDGPWLDMVAPRTDKPTFDGKLIALVGRWTGSMGEGMAVGLDGMARADVIGAPMAGLAGSMDRIVLENSGIPVFFATQAITHLDGTPRHEWRVADPIDTDVGDGSDTLLEIALARLRSARIEARQPSPTR